MNNGEHDVELTKLFEPVTVGKLELKNRLAMIGIGGFLVDHCRVTDSLKEFDGARARGGAGLIIRGNVHPGNIGPERMIGIWDDGFISGLRELTDYVHQQGDGVKYACQISTQHVWRRAPDLPLENVGPSDVFLRKSSPAMAKMIEVLSSAPRPLSIAEIEQITEEYGDAVRRAREAGFDAVEIMAGMGYLVSRFLSKLHNKRTDKYGGTTEDRARFLLDIIANARKKAGHDFPIIVRFLVDEFLQDGNTLEDGIEVAKLLETANVDLLDIQVGTQDSPVPVIQTSVPEGAFVHYSESIKKAVSIPVLTGIRISDPVFADKILREGKADVVGMARALIADPELPNKARAGKFDEIRPCQLCCYCLDVCLPGNIIRCAVNAQAGREREYGIQPALSPKRVVVIGGGIAGMETARVSAIRGHKVTLFEKTGRLGGQLQLASRPPYKSQISKLIDYQARQLSKVGVDVRLNVEATSVLVGEIKPDAIIIAAGAEPIIPKIPGVDGQNVVTAASVLAGDVRAGDEAIVIGGGLVGCETAETLLEQGKKVTIVEMLDRIGSDIGGATRWVIMQRLRQAGVRMERQAEVIKIARDGVWVKRNETSEFIKGDMAVIAVGNKSNTAIAEKLIPGDTPVLHIIGDGLEARRIVNAIEEAFRVALEL